LRLGGIGALTGLLGNGSSANYAFADGRKTAPTVPGFGKAKSVIVVFASGGQSQLDSWDPKPESPLIVRGEFDSIQSAVPGTFLCEHMPKIAAIADRLTIVRSMSHEDKDHGSAFYLSMSGHYYPRLSSNVPPKPTDRPTHGAILKRVRPDSPFVQPSIHINGPAWVPLIVGPGQSGGFLGREYDPMLIGDVTADDVAVSDLVRPLDVSAPRMSARRSLLSTLDHYRRSLADNRRLLDMDTRYSQAFEILDRPNTRDAFDLSQEPAKLRMRYGMNRSGQACLLARRLAQAGVPLITVIWNHNNRGQDDSLADADSFGWDTHNDIFVMLRNHLLPRFDQSFSALIEDLEDKGMLDETLVVCMGEFGRAPLVALEPNFNGATPGRKHWPSVYSIALAGASVQRGKIVGKSDRLGAHPASKKYGPWDVQATMFNALGIDPAGHYTDATGRPYTISDGKPMDVLYL
jgi:prepilin-type processing-associated H-X9-DG protein